MDINDLMPNGFDAANQPDPPKAETKPLPPGCPGNCMITPEPVFGQNKKQTGYWLKVEMIVLTGSYAGRKLWHYFNITNPNPLAEQIAKSELKKLCLAAGIPYLKSKAELTGKIVRPKIKVDGIYNVVTGYDVADMAELVAGQAAAAHAVNTTPFEGAADPVAETLQTAAEDAYATAQAAARAADAAAGAAEVAAAAAADPQPVALPLAPPAGYVPPEPVASALEQSVHHTGPNTAGQNPFPQQPQ